jgi:hypothetical protein
MELSVFDIVASPTARPNDTAVDATRTDDDDARFDDLVRAASHPDAPQDKQDQSDAPSSQYEAPEETSDPVAPSSTEATTTEAEAPSGDAEGTDTQVASTDDSGGETPPPADPPVTVVSEATPPTEAVAANKAATVVPSVSVTLPKAAAANPHAPTIMTGPANQQTNPDAPAQAAKPVEVADAGIKPTAPAPQPATATAPTVAQQPAPISPQEPSTVAAPTTPAPPVSSAVAPVETPQAPEVATRVAPQASTAPQSTAATTPAGDAPVEPDPTAGRLPATAAAAASTKNLADGTTNPAADDVPEDAKPELTQNAAAAAAAARAKSPQSTRPVWARTGAQPNGASPVTGQSANGQAATATGEAPGATTNASSARDVAITIGQDQRAPGQSVPLNSGTPDLAAFREALSSAQPESASGVSLEGIRASGRPMGTEIVARAQQALPSVPEQISIRVHQAVADGESQIRLQLQPKELGRIDIKLDVSDGGKVSVTVVAERSDTLDLLMRDQRGLERALQQAGLDTDPDSLAFDLRDPDDEGFGPDGDTPDGGDPDSKSTIETVLDYPPAGLTGDPALDGVDIRV